MLRVARQNGLEGVMAKRLASPYQPGRRSGDWLKIKIVQEQEFVVGGWVPLKGDARRGVGALLVGYYRPQPGETSSSKRRPPLVYAGKVGTGFTDEDRDMLKRRLSKLERATSPFGKVADMPQAFFVRPRTVIQVEYHGWTPVGKLRQPSYKGIRTDKDPLEVRRETPAA